MIQASGVATLAAARSPFGTFGGALCDFTVPALGGRVFAEAPPRSGLSPEGVDAIAAAVRPATGLTMTSFLCSCSKTRTTPCAPRVIRLRIRPRLSARILRARTESPPGAATASAVTTPMRVTPQYPRHASRPW